MGKRKEQTSGSKERTAWEVIDKQNEAMSRGQTIHRTPEYESWEINKLGLCSFFPYPHYLNPTRRSSSNARESVM
jgi:hypothetical protein